MTTLLASECPELYEPAFDFQCSCFTGFSGETCKIETSNPCETSGASLCLNGGTCVPENDYLDYNCICLDGFIGENCELTSLIPTSTPKTTTECSTYFLEMSTLF